MKKEYKTPQKENKPAAKIANNCLIVNFSSISPPYGLLYFKINKFLFFFIFHKLS